MRWLCAWLLSLGLPLIVPAQNRTVRIGVLGILHAQELTLAADPARELLISSADQRIFLRGGSTCSLLRIRSAGGSLLLSCGGKEIHVSQMRACGRNQQAAGLIIAVPGKIKRRYFGVLDLKIANDDLVPVVTMDLETAVASVVQAESAPAALELRFLRSHPLIALQLLQQPRRAISCLLSMRNLSPPCSREVAAGTHARLRKSACPKPLIPIFLCRAMSVTRIQSGGPAISRAMMLRYYSAEKSDALRLIACSAGTPSPVTTSRRMGKVGK